MPCWESNLISVDLKAADKETLDAALSSLGLTVIHNSNGLTIQTPAGTITIKDGKAEFYNEECQAWVNQIKRAYSIKTVEKIAKRFKFGITTKSGNKMILRRY